MPLFSLGIVETDTVSGAKPKIAFGIFYDTVYLIINQWLLVANGVFYPVITRIAISAYGNPYRVVGQPDAVFFVYINIVDTIAVHGIVFIIIGYDIRVGLIGVNIHFEYPCTIGSYQQFFVI